MRDKVERSSEQQVERLNTGQTSHTNGSLRDNPSKRERYKGLQSGVSREMSFLSQKEASFLSKKLIGVAGYSPHKASDEGRKRSTALPPLGMEREPTFQRQPRGTVSLQNPEEAGESHWHRKQKKVSVAVDKRVVGYLRKRLNRRLEERVQALLAESDSEEDTTMRKPGYYKDKKKYSQNGKTSKSPEITKMERMFSKYTETGEIVTPSPEHAKKPTKSTRFKEEITVNGQSVDNANVSESLSDISLNSRTPVLPNIQSPTLNVFDDTTKKSDDKEPDEGIKTSESEEEQDLLTQLGKITEDEISEGFRDVVVSPVQTPVLQRPITREQTRLETRDRISEILRGHIQRACPCNNKVLRMYVCADFSDTISERTYLIERTYPELRMCCLERGYDLEIYDLHWGIHDSSTDDHTLPDVCLKFLDQSINSPTGTNCLILLGEKYGQYLLPRFIPPDEFNTIYTTAKHHRKREIADLNEKIARVEKTSEEREQRRQQLEPENSELEATEQAMISGLEEELNIEVRKNSSNKLRTNAELLKREQNVVKSLKEKRDAMPSPELLVEWYKVDKNLNPPMYRLQNISTNIKEYTKGDAKRREAARLTWRDAALKLRSLFDEFARVVAADDTSKRHYFTSLFSREIEAGFINNSHGDDQIVVVQRSITDMCGHLHEAIMSDYTDLHPQHRRQASTQLEYLNKIKDEIILERIPQANVLPYEIEWAQGGIQLQGHRPHQVYLERMSKQTTETLKRQILRSLMENEESRDQRQILFEEVSQHVLLCHDKSRQFQGRKDLLQLIKSYLRSPCRNPLVLYGKAGSGKTAIASKVTKEIHKWLKGQSTSVLFRSVGLTTLSTNVRTLLRNLCLQLCYVFEQETDDVPYEYKALINFFQQICGLATPDQPLFIVLDALDCLSDEHDARKLTWLPKVLPQNVKLILTTNPHEKFECFPNLQKLFNANNEIFAEVPEMPVEDAVVILEHWLKKNKRTLTQNQSNLIVRAFQNCPLPLYLRMVFEESILWSSYTAVDHIKFPDTITKFAAHIFAKLEVRHGEALVRRAVGYISASLEGVTSNEMEDILSLDEAVMDEVMLHYRPPRRRLPSVLWIRLREDLQPFLAQTVTHGVITLRWKHAQFDEAAVDRYLNQRDKSPSYHKAMAEYFLGIWSTKPKPHTGNDKGSWRYVSSQPLYYEPEDSLRDGSDRICNIRRVNELPHHLLNSQQMGLYKSQALCNFEWAHAKLCGTSLRALIEEYEVGLAVEPTDVDLKTLSDTIQLSANALMKDPRQLATQMVGRLHNLVTNDVPRAPGDPPRYPYLQEFFRQAQCPSLPAMVPSVGCLTEPGGILFDLLSGHSEPITAVGLTTDGLKALTASTDNTMKLWDLRSGKVMKTINDVGRNISIIKAGYNNAYIVTAESNVIRVWNLRYKELVLTIDKYPDPPVIGMAAEGKFLVALFDGNNMLRAWNLNKAEFPLTCEVKVEDHRVFKGHSALIAPLSYEDKILHASRGANLGLVHNVKNGKLVHTLKCNDSSSAVTSVGITRDYYILACRQHYMHLHEIHQLELFDVKKGRYLRSVRGCISDRITELHLNYIGSHAIAVCASEETGTSDIAIWNVETEDHKHLARHSGVSNMSAISDFRYCLTASKNDKALRIWNLTSKINVSLPKLKKQLGVNQIIQMKDNPRYVVARQINNGPVSVWNVARARMLKTAVRIERSLSDSSDVVVIRDTKVVILTNKGILNDARPVFQDIHIYDLLHKKFVKKVEKCFITPCPAHEYVILNDEHMLGLSPNRNYFIIWSIVNGHEVQKIKPVIKIERNISLDDARQNIAKRATTAKMTPWERRAESKSAKQKRREKELELERKRIEDLLREKDNGIDKYLLSGNQKIAVASFFAHHMCVFDIENYKHLTTLVSDSSMLFLLVAALTYTGDHLVQATYDEDLKTSSVILWDCFEGKVKMRLKNESDVMALGISDDAKRIVIGKGNQQISIWEPYSSNPLQRISSSKCLMFDESSKIFLIENDTRAVVFAGDISVWDLDRRVLLSVFTPDTRITCCNIAMNGKLITFGMHEISDIVIMKLVSKNTPALLETEGEDMFGEKPDESSEEEDIEED